jgi:hypothetical protein
MEDIEEGSVFCAERIINRSIIFAKRRSVAKRWNYMQMVEIKGLGQRGTASNAIHVECT